MALIKTGSIVTKLSGKIGGQSFGKGRSGAYLKNIGSYPRSLTLFQNRFLSLSSTLAQKWRGLTNEERTSWDAATINFPYTNRVDDVRFLSGFNLFVKLNGNRASLGLPIVTEPSELFIFDEPNNFLIELVTEGIRVSAGTAQAGVDYLLFFTHQISQGRKAAGLNFFLIGQLNQSQVEAGIFINSQFASKFGPRIDGYKTYFRVKAVESASGQTINNWFEGSLTFV